MVWSMSHDRPVLHRDSWSWGHHHSHIMHAGHACTHVTSVWSNPIKEATVLQYLGWDTHQYGSITLKVSPPLSDKRMMACSTHLIWTSGCRWEPSPPPKGWWWGSTYCSHIVGLANGPPWQMQVSYQHLVVAKCVTWSRLHVRYWITNGSLTKSIPCHLFSTTLSLTQVHSIVHHISDTPPFAPVPLVFILHPCIPVSLISDPLSLLILVSYPIAVPLVSPSFQVPDWDRLTLQYKVS